jgi:alkanesulfonate monooxygenase SsuD/methylene tetrahydromethanopterin reductase-like flavin-dependent oxidoreductase (luciferase family)
MRLSVLDQSTSSKGRGQDAAIRESRAVLDRLNRRALIGSASQIAKKLNELATRLSLDELVINTWTFDPAARLRSYLLLAKEFLPAV